jgi:hypothetical protein
MATFRELIANIDKSKENSAWVYLDDIASSEFGINGVRNIDAELNSLKSFHLGSWYCTDSWVGYNAYFLEDSFVAISIQDGRKSDVNFTWANDKSYIAVKNYLLSLMVNDEDEDQFDTLSDEDFNEEMGVGFAISFTSQLLNKELYYKGVLCPTVGNQFELNDRKSTGKNVKILYHGAEIVVDIANTLVPWNLKDLKNSAEQEHSDNQYICPI